MAISSTYELTALDGVVARVVYHNPTTGFSVLSVRNGSTRLRVVGVLPSPREGMHVRVEGNIEKDTNFGEQLRAVSLAEVEPTSSEGITSYLSSGLIEGIGPAMAARIVSHFGEDTLSVLRANPERLWEVRGIGAQRLASIREGWAAHAAVRDLMLFLTPHGVTPSKVIRIHKTMGAHAVALIREDPFCLAERVDGIGFLTADAIAQRLGVGADSPSRIAAGLLHVLAENRGAGHCYTPRAVLLEGACELLKLDGEFVELVLVELIRRRRVVDCDVGPPTAVSRWTAREPGPSGPG